jgi:gamma-glutamyltranspeptidase/glutathione hydrolase
MKFNSRLFSISFLLLLVIFSCKETPKLKVETDKEIGLLADSAMVVSARKEASAIGLSILKKGGNAFDAMIATDLALTVAYPFAGNIGGGGFMVFRTADGKTGALDYREKAPLAATKDMYLDEKGNIIKGKSTLGGLAVGVPGTVAGLFAVHEKLGSLPFSELIQPAIDLAKKGVLVTKKQAKRLAHYRKLFKEANQRVILLDKEWKAGDTIKYLDLAKTLERIRDNGRKEFYGGETGKMLVSYLATKGGVITLEDLEKYEAKWRKPVKFTYKDYTITSMTLPSSGGICIAQILKSVEPYNIAQFPHNSDKYIQLLTEAERRAYADRSHYLGDIDFVDVPMDSLTDDTYLKRRMASFDWDKATKSSDISFGKIKGYESNETTHYSIVDKFGNAVAVTTTLNGAYGSKVYVENGGFFLNNEMDDFSAKPGVPNMFGLVGAEANAIAPEKRMLSSMSPSIVQKDGKLVMVLGSPGGSTIITSVLQNILNVTEYKMGMQESVAQPRFHHQWLPDVIKMEPKGFDSITKQKLISKGYKIDESNSVVIGKVDAILVRDDGKLEGGADPRGDDTAVGY